jgi:large conductance mechanosensitive channel
MYGFITFIREQGIIGLAVGFILGGAVSKVVQSLVTDIINPLIGFLVGSTESLSSMMIGPVAFGNFLVVLIDFLIVALVVYVIFKQIGVGRLDSPKQ